MRDLDPSLDPLLGSPVAPPRDWFEKPEQLGDATYISVEPSGRVHGRFFSAGAPLLSDDGTVRVPPASPTGYEVFRRSSVRTAEGAVVRVGAITMGAHAPSASDDPRNIICTVVAGDDRLGGWFSGALVPEATVSDAAFVARSQLSGEWVPMSDDYFASRGVAPGAGLELSGLALCTVGRALLRETYKGHPVSVHRATVDELERRDKRVRDALRAAIDDADSPAAAVAGVRQWLDDEDSNESAIARRRVAALAPPRLPTERASQPIRSST